MNNDDQEWLETLAGKSQGSKQSTQQIEAAVVRRALLARRESIEHESEKLDQIQFSKMKQTLVKHGHLATETKTKSQFQRQIALIGSFIAGSISSGLLVLGFTTQVMITRGGSEVNIERQSEASDKNELKSMITLQATDPIALAHSLESKAWETGLPTSALSMNGEVLITIKGLSENNNDQAELKLLLGIHPQTKGDITVKISK